MATSRRVTDEPAATLDEALATREPLVFLVGADDHRLPLALAKASGSTVAKRALFRGRAHPKFLSCVALRSRERRFWIFDAGAAWHRALQMFFNDYFVPDVLRAAERATSIVIDGAAPPGRTSVLARIARTWNPRSPVIALGGWTALCESEVEPELAVPAIEGRGRKTESAVETLLHALGDRLAAPKVDHEPTLLIPDKVVGYGIKPNVMRAIGRPYRGTIAVGQRLDVLREGAAVSTTVEALDDEGVIFSAKGVEPNSVVSLASPGTAAAATAASYTLSYPSVGGEGRLYLGNRAFGPCNASDQVLAWRSPDLLRRGTSPALVIRAGLRFLVGHETNGDDIRVTIGSMTGDPVVTP